MIKKSADFVKKVTRQHGSQKAAAIEVGCDPKPLPTPRPRALSLSSKTDDTPEPVPAQMTLNQSIFPLFKLPLELRNLVYMFVLDGQRLHIGTVLWRLAHIKCTGFGVTARGTRLHACWGPPCELDNDIHILGDGRGGLLALLKTCRLM